MRDAGPPDRLDVPGSRGNTMSKITGREIHLASRPEALPTDDTFELVEVPVPEPEEGQIQVRNVWMSVDPYMRGRTKSYVGPYEVGEPLGGGCVGRVIASRHADFSRGDWVLADRGWREWWTTGVEGVRPIDPRLAPPQRYLGVLGMPGLTAYVGLLHIVGLQEGESVLVSSAAGAVGSVACQIAKLKRCRVTGIAGGEAKCAWLRDDLGLDAAIDYKHERSLPVALRRACPDGIDVYFDNVGGDTLDAALLHMRDHGRIALCGMISQYNDPQPPPGPRFLVAAVTKRLTLRGFIVRDHLDLLPPFHHDMSSWLLDGLIKSRETIYQGLDKAPEAFLALFSGAGTGKVLVRLGPDDLP
jgi:NADPH-dependent curcumin reductase CurA